MESDSLFEGAISLYFFFYFRTLKFEVWSHRMDNSSTRFRDYDWFLHPGLQLMKLNIWQMDLWPPISPQVYIFLETEIKPVYEKILDLRRCTH